MRFIIFAATHYGLAISAVGVIFSLILLRNPGLRKQSKMPAIICLVFSLLYLGAFVYTNGEEQMHAWFDGDDGQKHAGAEMTTPLGNAGTHS
jgi:hypothetical protein